MTRGEYLEGAEVVKERSWMRKEVHMIVGWNKITPSIFVGKEQRPVGND